jgi:hypothetical protein
MFKIFGSGGKGGKRIPSDRVMQLSSQGMPETQIITTLKNEGYSPGEVDAAMRQAIRGAVGGPSRGPGTGMEPPAPQEDPGMPPPGPPEPRYSQTPPPPGLSQEPPPYGRPPPGMGIPPASRQDDSMGQPPSNVSSLGMPPLPGEPGFDPQRDLSPPGPPEAEEEPIPAFRERSSRSERAEDRRRIIEEMVEGIVDERWTQLSAELNTIRNEFSLIQGKIETLEKSLKKTESEKDTGFVDIKDKIDTYKGSIGEISSRMGAVEDAMKNTMTPMMQTMRSLTDAVKELKDQKTGSSDLPESRSARKPSGSSDDDAGYDDFDDGPESDLEKKP